MKRGYVVAEAGRLREFASGDKGAAQVALKDAQPEIAAAIPVTAAVFRKSRRDVVLIKFSYESFLKSSPVFY